MSFCVQDYCKSNHLISLQLVVLIGPSNRKNRLTSSDDPILETDSASVFTSLVIGEQRILGPLLDSQQPIFTTLGEMTDTGKVVNPQHFAAIRQTSRFESGLIRI